MTIEEAIEHCKEVAKESREAALSYARENAYETAISCKACGQEHEQLAEWLTELKQRREAEITAPPKSNGGRNCRGCKYSDWDVDGCTCMIDGRSVYNASAYTCDQYRPAKPLTNADRNEEPF